MDTEVRVRRERVVLPTYEPDPPDKNPMFLEKRVYQGSRGRVYPLPFYNRIAEAPTDREWDAIYLDNGLIEVMLLPEIGGRVHAIRDLSNGYEAIYRQHVIKPALVGLSGPWVSGGIEFNWPQHHRPSTFMPAGVAIQHADDGSVTVWMGEHEPMDRTKGMHGVCLLPGRSVVEIKVRLYNRTPYVQTFLWWANIATHVHQGYKSFFPPDCHLVADHAKRALSDYPLCDGRYYGVDYSRRGLHGVPEEERPAQFLPKNCGGAGPEYPSNDLSWYANIPVPTSYMCIGSEQDFVGGYDFFKGAGLLHVANHHISPGKKQWTWGNHEFGYAWDRNLTDADGPYIEIMAGLYTDNQPDFSYIAPGETRTFSQFLYPYREIGPASFANVDVAISVGPRSVGIAATRRIDAEVRVEPITGHAEVWQLELRPDQPFVKEFTDPVEVRVTEGGKEIAACAVQETEPKPMKPATEPPPPDEVSSSDELFLIGQHLEQYRHATRHPADYWEEALKRDPGDLRCNNGLGLWRLRRGEFETARDHFQVAIDRATSRNPNPRDGEPFYNLGLALRFLGQDKEAEDAFAKSAWNAAWQAAAYHALAELTCRKGDWQQALGYLDRSLRQDQDNFRAANLRTIVHRKLGRVDGVSDQLKADPLDYWGCHLAGRPIPISNSVRLDIAIDLLRAGLFAEAAEILEPADLAVSDGTVPMVWYYRAYVLSCLGQDPAETYRNASAANPDYCFPSRLEDIDILSAAPRSDARAPFYLGNLLYDRRRYAEAIEQWERAVALEPGNSVALRNLGIAAFNVQHDPVRAQAFYDRAISAAPEDDRLWYERDQLHKRIGDESAQRLRTLEARRDLVAKRDDLTIEFCSLLDAAGRAEEAAAILAGRRFQPWEGGESMALGIYTRVQLSRAKSNPDRAVEFLAVAIHPPSNLGEARHLLANASDLWLAYGDALTAAGHPDEAWRWWSKAADFQGDFQEMAVQPFSELTCYQALAMIRLGRAGEAENLLLKLRDYADQLAKAEAKIDYFATSLPTMLLFEDDLQARQNAQARRLHEQAELGLSTLAHGLSS